MIGGIGLIGFVTGSLASWIVERISSAERVSEATKEDVNELLAEIRQLRADVAGMRGADTAASGGDPDPETRRPEKMPRVAPAQPTRPDGG